MELTKTKWVGSIRLGSCPDWEDVEEAKNELANRGATSTRLYINDTLGPYDGKEIVLNGYRQEAI